MYTCRKFGEPKSNEEQFCQFHFSWTLSFMHNFVILPSLEATIYSHFVTMEAMHDSPRRLGAAYNWIEEVVRLPSSQVTICQAR